MSQARAKSMIGQVLQGTYHVGRLLGEGGMGAVYEASHERLPRRFAIKVLSPAVLEYPDAMARFQREARITSGLGHPHIIEVVDFNETEEGTPYIVMEYLDGEDLAALLASSPSRRLSIARSLAIVEQVCSALQAAHKQGVVHRDLKPANIFLCKQPDGEAEGELVKVVDFGISKVLGSTGLTQSQSAIGTPWYMSPEQAEGRSAQLDSRTDIFSLGAILYEMLCGHTPFAAETIPAVLYKVVHYEPPALSEQRPDAPVALSAAIGRAMSKATADRFATMAEFAAALKGAAANKAPIAPERAATVDAMSATLPVLEKPAPSAKQRSDAAISPTMPAPLATPHLAPKNVASTPLSEEVATRPFDPARNRVLAAAAAVFVLVAGGALFLHGMAESDDPAPTLDARRATKTFADRDPDGLAIDAAKPDSSSPKKPRVRKPARKHRVTGQSTNKHVVCTLIIRRGQEEKVDVKRVPCHFEVAHGSRIEFVMAGNNKTKSWRKRVTRNMSFRFQPPAPPTPKPRP